MEARTERIMLPSETEMRIMCALMHKIPDNQWMNAVLAANSMHKATKFGHAYLVPEGQDYARMMYDHWVEFELGLVGPDFLFEKVIAKALQQARDIFAEVEKETRITA